MPDPQHARDLYEEGLPDIDPTNPSGEEAQDAADRMHAEADDLAEDADPSGAGHGPSTG